MNDEFLEIVEKYEVQIPAIMQICNVPIAVLLRWYKHGAPDSALSQLKAHLGIED